jgi:hypothetical protein
VPAVRGIGNRPTAVWANHESWWSEALAVPGVLKTVRLSRVRTMFWLLAIAMLVVVILAAKA